METKTVWVLAKFMEISMRRQLHVLVDHGQLLVSSSMCITWGSRNSMSSRYFVKPVVVYPSTGTLS